MQLAIAIKTRDYTADTSALKRSVPREQGSRIRHSRPENSAAPASRMHTAMSEVVGPERGEGVVLAHRMLPWKAHAAVVALATLPACSCHTARTVAFSLSLGFLGGRTRLLLAGGLWGSLLSATGSVLLSGLLGRSVQCVFTVAGSCTPCRWKHCVRFR